MLKVEITQPLKLTTKEEAQIAMHSFYNILNVIVSQLLLLREILNNEKCLEASVSLCQEILSSFSDPELALVSANNINNYKTIIFDDINKALEENTVKPDYLHFINNSLENLENVFNVIDARVREVLARTEVPNAWVPYYIEYIYENIKQILDCMAKNSHGRYGIVYSKEQQGPDDYLVEIDIRSSDDHMIIIPSILHDCFRDLIANARKYTKPGGRISASLVDDGQWIELNVSDTGRGIPSDEIESVVNFGIRGSNTLKTETKGGGYGLTKAYYNCRQFGGRMWIESEPDAGTTITIRIPRLKEHE